MSPNSSKQGIRRGLGWIPDLPDHRDFLYSAPVRVLRALPDAADLTSQCPPIYDQGNIGSCTANAIAGAIQFDRMKASQKPDLTPSRLFIYYNERAMEGTIDSDSGAMIRDGIKSVAKQGVCPEDKGMPGTWLYDGSEFPGAKNHDKRKPSAVCYKAALKHKVISYQRLVQNLNQMKGCLADGFPFVFGFTVYDSIYDKSVDKTGDIPMPRDGDSVVGGHAVMAVGYNEQTRLFIIRNSWGTGWGNKGYGTLPYSYLIDTNLASDFWTVRGISG